jgi:endoglucanase
MHAGERRGAVAGVSTSTIRVGLVSVLLGAAAAGCEIGKPPNEPGVDESAGGKCPPDAVVDDMEDGDNQVKVHAGRGGYIYTYKDDAGATITPGEQFTMSAGGANGSKRAARIHGKVGTGETVYAGVGFNFVDPKGAWDGSRFSGIAFWAKVAPGSANKVRVKIPDANTDPDGKKCSECYNDFGVDLVLSNEWKRYAVGFDSMSQEEGWGQPRPGGLDTSKMFGVQFQLRDAGASFDLWLDDIELTGC